MPDGENRHRVSKPLLQTPDLSLRPTTPPPSDALPRRTETIFTHLLGVHELLLRSWKQCTDWIIVSARNAEIVSNSRHTFLSKA
jgi:hypothetical protein